MDLECARQPKGTNNHSQIKMEQKSFQVNSKSLELFTMASLYHIELNPSDVGHYDRHVMQEVIKDIAQSQPLGMTAQRTFKGEH